MYNNDTIAAITTAPGESGIAVIRISGPNSISIADKIFSSKKKKPSEMSAGTFQYGHIYTEFSDLDEVILLIYHAPHSYTKENVVEIQGHGGRIASQRILRAVLNAGARPAEPGEFTKRAFLNGRIDLLQAEAVLDIIQAHTERAAIAAIEQLEGRLSASFNNIYEKSVNVAANLTVLMDFYEGELDDSVIYNVINDLKTIFIDAEKLLLSWDEGRILREGAKVVIAGKPNVGKSTLLNKLLGNERSIVTHIAGTTRDIIEEELVINGIPIRLVDTAGLRKADCIVEQQGIERAQSHIQNSDILLYMIDAHNTLSSSDLGIISDCDNNSIIIILNKIDLGNKIDLKQLNGYTVVQASLQKEEGIDEIKQAIAEKLHITASPQPHAVISERHRNIIHLFLNELNNIINMLSTDVETMLVPAVSSLQNTIENLGTATGKIYSDDLLENIFNRFCIGK